MLQDFIKAGDKVELQAADHMFNNKQETSRKYLSRVFDVLGDDRLEIVMPMEKTKLILLPVEGEYEICFYSSQGLYQCYARIYDRYKSNNVYVLAFEVTSNLRKHQRREYYRFSCVMDMRCRDLKPDEAATMESDRPVIVPGLPLRRSLICDISGGGMRFVTDVNYEENSYVYCTFPLTIDGVSKDFEVTGKILVSKSLPNRPGQYEHRMQYIHLPRDTREEIIKFIFDEERRLRRNKRV